jgi:hypothetical protein
LKATLYSPHGVILYRVPIFVVRGYSDTITDLTQIGKHMSTNLEFCLLQPGVAMRWALDETKLGTIGCRREMNVEGQCDYMSVR